MTQQVKVLMGFSFGLLNKMVAYVKDEGPNITSITTTLIVVISGFFVETCHSFHWFLFWACYV
jgi:hypothetical protein